MDSFDIILPEATQSLTFSRDALLTFLDARQMHLRDKESGGILFAEITNTEVRIVKATRAEKRASISRVLFKPSLRKKRIAVKEAFKSGLHFVGEWHTHPEQDPTPSRLDTESMEDSFKRSKHELERFIMIIVGNREDQLSLSVTFHSESGIRSLGVCKIDI
ncbi:MAG: Mov34/MPN/PAD-1 family protein [Opitutaceae bacterium]